MKHMAVESEVNERPDPSPKMRVVGADAQLFHRFTLQDILGRGRMGLVWLARDDRLKRLVALKLVPEAVCLEAAAQAALKRATLRSVLLAHPNIARIFDFMEDERSAAISMEYVDGPTLSHLRLEKRAKCFAVSEIAPWVTSLCDALAYAHDSAGLLHGDLKTSNLMVNSRKELKVTDFGIVVASRNSMSLRASSGTLGYLSPQQLLGETPAPTDDVYALGATLYELLSGKPPFYGVDVAAQVRDITPPRVAERREKLGIAGEAVPEDWEETIAACLAKNPSDRPQTPVEVARRLGLGGTIRLVAAQEESKVRALLQSLTHARVVGAAAGVAVLIAAAVLAMHPVHLQLPEAKQLVEATVPDGYAMELLRPETAAAKPLLVPDAKPAPVPVAVAPRNGSLKLASTPAGAGFAIYSGVIAGTTAPTTSPLHAGTAPDSVDDLPPGRYTVFFRIEGWPEERTEVALEERTTLPVTCVFPHGSASITSTPEGAEIFLGPRSLGHSPLTVDLPLGKQELTARYPERPERTRTVMIESGAPETLDFQMRTASHAASKRKAKPPESTLGKIGHTLKNVFSRKTPPNGKKP